jgi:prepilin-type N-terminal cleavage/methylation domain-containing protein
VKRRLVKKHAQQGFTLTEIMIVVMIIGLLAAIASPSFINARTTSRMNACINNLRQLTGAKDQWAMENAKTETDPVVMNEVIAYVKGGLPTCPSSGTYTFTTVGTNATCTIAGHVQ